jgi:hypothetical protein
MFGKILAAGNVRWEDLPILPEFIDEQGRNIICFDHVCGRCPFQPCRLQKGYVPKEKIPDAWVERLWQKIEPGITHNLRMLATGADAGSPAKG